MPVAMGQCVGYVAMQCTAHLCFINLTKQVILLCFDRVILKDSVLLK